MQQKYRYVLIIFLFFSALANCFANSSSLKVDSLKALLTNQQPTAQKRVDLYNKIGKGYILRQKDSLHHYANLAIGLANDINYSKGKLGAYYLIANSAFQNGQFEEGDNYLNLLRRLSEDLNNDKGKADVYFLEGLKFLHAARFQESIESLKTSNSLYHVLNDIEGLTNSHNILGQVYGQTSANQEALEEYLLSLQYAEELKDRLKIAGAYNNLASIYDTQKKYSKAIVHYQKGMDIAEELEDDLLVGICSNNIGLIYETMKNFEEAQTNYDKFYEKIKDEDNPFYIYVYYENTGNIYYEKEKYKAALTSYKQCLQKAEESKNLVAIGLANDRIGKSLRKQGKPEEALLFHKKALSIFKDIGLKPELATCKTHLAEAYKDLGEQQLALQYAQEAYNWTKKNPDAIEIRKSCTEVISKIYKELKNYELAYDFHIEYANISDSIRTATNIWSIEKYRLEQTLKERAEEEERAAMESYLTEQAQTKIRSIIGFVIAFLLLLGAYGYLKTQRANKIIKKKSKEISEKNEALKAQTEKLERINSTKDKLFAIVSHDLRGPIGGLEQVLEMLISGEISQDEFMEMADDLKQNTSDIHQLLENLLQWSYGQMQEEKEVIQTQVFSIESITDNITGALRELAKKKKIKLECVLDENLYIKADPNHVSLIIRNLLSNAIKFTPKGGEVKISAKIGMNKMVTFLVEDNGIGMHPEQIQKICAGESTPRWGTNGEKGVGLGLSISKEMVLKNGGSVWLESDVNKGSAFYFTLPLAEKSIVKKTVAEKTRIERSSFLSPHHVSDPSA